MATVSYLLTIEPTASYWDCGEFICTAFRQEVGHPPGAPLFMILGRFFSLFAFGDVEKVAVMINSMSAIASGFTILFLYWSITHIGRRIVCANSHSGDMSACQLISVIGSGVVGALTFAYTDTFWFSAVEGEVYAMSSLFTAVVFWCILKWEDEAGCRYANRWLVLICYLMGLSIGVHLLNLLVIPAIVFVYYFRIYKTSARGLLKAFLVSCALLAGILYGIIPGVVKVASWFELLFTNGMGMPYNTGTVIYVILGVGALVYGLRYTIQKRKAVLNTILLCVSVIIIGYSSYAMIVIRSAANPPMDENNPNNVFALQSYLNREQYGDRPLIWGEYYNSPIVGYSDTKPTYIQRNGRYEIVDYKMARDYEPGSTTLFPRMYSIEPQHISGYLKWTGLGNKEIRPSFADNIKFFLKYQVGYMYFRYFMWNFAGRQNDLQGHDGNVMNGNWISGISWLDNARLGDQSLMSDTMRANKGNNKYYFLPLILGILGMLYLLTAGQSGKQYFWVVFMFFFLTGVAIVMYLNQTPYQPRERDYAYAGSFYAFAMYIGFGAAWLCSLAEKHLGGQKPAASGALALCMLGGPVILASQNWDDHDRTGRYTARDFAKNYLESCEPNAILFTNGDNDTFPLWYAQEVEGIRTDVRVVNLAYLNADWYINQMRNRAYLSDPLPISIEPDKIVEGSRDIVYIQENPSLFVSDRYEANRGKYAQAVDMMHERLIQLLRASKLQQILPDDYAAVVEGGQLKDKPLDMSRIIAKISANPGAYGADPQLAKALNSDMAQLMGRLQAEPVPLSRIVDFISSDDKATKIMSQAGEMVDYIPAGSFSLAVDKAKVLANGTVSESDSAGVVDRLEWKHPRGYLRKGEVILLDILAHNNWERPVYFAITVGDEAFQGLGDYFRLDGLAYRLVPVKTVSKTGDRGYVDPDILYNSYCRKFVWGGIDNPDVYLDENNMRMLMNVKSGFCRLADALLSAGDRARAVEVLDRSFQVMPPTTVPPSYYDIFLADVYYRAGCVDKARAVVERFSAQNIKDLRYMMSLSIEQQATVEDGFYRVSAIAHEIVRVLRENNDSRLAHKYALEYAQVLKDMPLLTNVTMEDFDTESFYKIYLQMTDLEKQLVQIYMFMLDESL